MVKWRDFNYRRTETPEWQGFIATGTKQGMYRAVPCVDTKVNANAVRIVTVLAPYQAGAQCKRLVGVKASLDAADMDITLVFDDGSEWALNEEELVSSHNQLII